MKKKLLLISILIIIIPYLVVTFLVKSDKFIEKKYKFVTNNNTIVRVMRTDSNIIEEVPLEEYIVGVVSSEMPTSFHIEALKAQAVASRNYVYKKINASKDREYDVVDTTDNQVYKNIEELKKEWGTSYIENINKVRQAVYETQGEYVTYNNEVIDLYYFSTSNGYTEDAYEVFKIDEPYLKSVESKWDVIENPNYEKKQEIKKEEFCNILEITCENIEIGQINRDNSNRITNIEINNKIFDGRELYTKLKLRSTDFDIDLIDNNIVFTTRGYGHGVGMSQYGANGMAKEGYSYKEILEYYYKDATLKKL